MVKAALLYLYELLTTVLSELSLLGVLNQVEGLPPLLFYISTHYSKISNLEVHMPSNKRLVSYPRTGLHHILGPQLLISRPAQ